MADSNARLYELDEIQDILKAAAQRQHAEPPAEAPSGLTLEELQQAAAEAGIEPRHVEAVVAERRPQTTREEGRWGPNPYESAERLVPGGVDDALWQTLTRRAEQAFGIGTTSQHGTLRQWTTGTGAERQQVTVQQRDGQTHVRVTTAYPRGQRAAFVPFFVGAAVVATVLFLAFSVPVAAVGSAGAVALAYVVGRMLHRYQAGYHATKVQRVADELKGVIAAAGVAVAQAAPEETTAPPLLDEQPEERQTDAEEVARRNQERS
ncbi:MAG: hypothetical protein AAGI71_12705 [Bacteroidota bacterium]